VVLDPKLFKMVNLTGGLKEGAAIVMNGTQKEFPMDYSEFNFFLVDASSISRKFGLGPKTAPIVNTSILGAVVKVTEVVQLDSLCQAIKEGVPSRQRENIEAAKEAYHNVVSIGILGKGVSFQ
jgi:2-oxoacid:acceptor oxidoreductase gamma subunit (pyruvate/2-ketoisovalerate family)